MNKEKTYQSWYVFIYYSVTLGVSASDTVIVLATVTDAPLYVIVYFLKCKLKIAKKWNILAQLYW